MLTKIKLMPSVLRNILAVVAGLIIGGAVNSGIILLGPNLIPPPEGVDPNALESMKANVDLYGAKHFIIPFLAHAVGTLIGAFTAVKLGISRHKLLAYIIAGLFLLGGLMMAIMLPEFWKFSIIDLSLAYIPMALFGYSLAKGDKTNRSALNHLD